MKVLAWGGKYFRPCNEWRALCLGALNQPEKATVNLTENITPSYQVDNVTKLVQNNQYCHLKVKFVKSYTEHNIEKLSLEYMLSREVKIRRSV